MLFKTLKQIGERIRYYRIYQYRTLPRAAKAAGLPKSTWSKIENGKSNFSITTMRKVCRALNVNPTDIL